MAMINSFYDLRRRHRTSQFQNAPNRWKVAVSFLSDLFRLREVILVIRQFHRSLPKTYIERGCDSGVGDDDNDWRCTKMIFVDVEPFRAKGMQDRVSKTSYWLLSSLPPLLARDNDGHRREMNVFHSFLDSFLLHHLLLAFQFFLVLGRDD